MHAVNNHCYIWLKIYENWEWIAKEEVSTNLLEMAAEYSGGKI